MLALSKRLLAVSKMIMFRTVADVGSGHALLPIYIVEKGICDKVLATELNKGPMEITRKAIEEKGLSKVIESKHGNGLDPIEAGSYETLIIAGMGGLTVEGILRRDIAKSQSFKQHVLQPQGYEASVRIAIHDLGFMINDENIVYEDGHFYFIISAIKGFENNYSYIDYKLGKLNIQKKNDVLKYYLSKEIKILDEILYAVSQGQSSHDKNKTKEEALLLRNCYNELLMKM